MAGVTRTERWHWLIYPALMGLGAGLLTSCAEKPPPPPTQKVELPASTPPLLAPAPKRRVFPVPEHKPAPPADDAAGSDAADQSLAMAGPEPPAGSSEPVAVPPRASKLIGLDQPAAAQLFGTATEKSEAPPATVWRYRSASCELDLFFYLDLRSGKMRTLHYAFKGDAADPAQQQECLRSLVVARAN
ncbi:MAG TPA: hypothetical protein VGR45_12275 [Stellaceae bacterium]|nr:hypothetical protein [Stellaceae bacterium]